MQIMKEKVEAEYNASQVSAVTQGLDGTPVVLIQVHPPCLYNLSPVHFVTESLSGVEMPAATEMWQVLVLCFCISTSAPVQWLPPSLKQHGKAGGIDSRAQHASACSPYCNHSHCLEQDCQMHELVSCCSRRAPQAQGKPEPSWLC